MAQPVLIFTPGILSPVTIPIDDGLNLVSNVSSIAWQVDTRISAFSSIVWRIKQQGVSSFAQASWNTLHRIEAYPTSFIVLFIPGILSPVVNPIDYGFIIESTVNATTGLVRPVVYPIDIRNFLPTSAWQVDIRQSVNLRTAWKLTARSFSRKKINWNILNRLTNDQPVIAYRVLRRIYIPGVTLEEFNTGIIQPVVHPVSYSKVLPPQNISWQLNERIFLREKTSWNLLQRKSVSQRILFNTNGILVSPTAACSWNTLGLVTVKRIITWNLIKRLPVQRKTTWNTVTRTSVQEPVRWRLLNKVTKTGAVSWNLVQRPVSKVNIEWNLYDRLKLFANSSFQVRLLVIDRPWYLISNSPGSICTSIVHPIDVGNPAIRIRPNKGLCQPVVYPIDYGNTVYPGYGNRPTAQIQWRVGINPAGRVSATVSSSFNTLGPVRDRGVIQWNMNGRNASKALINYNVLISIVVRSAPSSWIAGKPVSQHIRQTSIDRLDFAY